MDNAIKNDIAALADRLIERVEMARDDIRDCENSDDALSILSHLDIAERNLATVRRHVESLLVNEPA